MCHYLSKLGQKPELVCKKLSCKKLNTESEEQPGAFDQLVISKYEHLYESRHFWQFDGQECVSCWCVEGKSEGLLGHF